MPDGIGTLGAAVGLGSTGGGGTDEPSPSSIGGTDGIDLRDIEMDWSDVDRADPEIGGGYGKNEMTWDRVEGYGRSSLEAMETDEIKDVVDFVEDEGGEVIIAESIDAYGGPDAEDYVSETAKKTTSGVISGAVLGGAASGGDPETTAVAGVLGGIKRGAVAPVKEKGSHELDERTEKPLGEYASVGGAVEFVKEAPEILSETLSDVASTDGDREADSLGEASQGPTQESRIEDDDSSFGLNDIEMMDSDDWLDLEREQRHEAINTLADSGELDDALYGTLSDLERQEVGTEDSLGTHAKTGAISGGVSGATKSVAEDVKDAPVDALTSGARKGGTTAVADAVVESVWDETDADDSASDAVEWASKTKEDAEKRFSDWTTDDEADASGDADKDELVGDFDPSQSDDEHKHMNLETEGEETE